MEPEVFQALVGVHPTDARKRSLRMDGSGVFGDPWTWDDRAHEYVNERLGVALSWQPDAGWAVRPLRGGVYGTGVRVFSADDPRNRPDKHALAMVLAARHVEVEGVLAMSVRLRAAFGAH